MKIRGDGGEEEGCIRYSGNAWGRYNTIGSISVGLNAESKQMSAISAARNPKAYTLRFRFRFCFCWSTAFVLTFLGLEIEAGVGKHDELTPSI